MWALKGKLTLYKRLFQISLLINGFFIAAGVVGVVRYLEVHDIRALHLIIIGAGTFIFGVFIPWVVFKRLSNLNRAIRRQTEDAVARWISAWVETYKDADGEIFTDPIFWINVLLMTVEVFGENSSNPSVEMLVELMPIIRRELKKSKTKKKVKA